MSGSMQVHDEQELAAAPRRGWVRQTSVRSMASVLWHRQCVQERRPFVMVRVYRTQAVVEMELDTAGVAFTDAGLRRLGGLTRQFRFAGGYSPRHLRGSRMPLVDAEALADALVGVIADGANVRPHGGGKL